MSQGNRQDHDVVIGGSSGVLYGSAYIAASKGIKEKDALHDADLCAVLKAMLDAIVARGRQRRLQDHDRFLAPAVKKYEDAWQTEPRLQSYVSWLRRLQRMAQRIPRIWKQSEDAQAIRQPRTGSSGSGRCYHVLSRSLL